MSKFAGYQSSYHSYHFLRIGGLSKIRLLQSYEALGINVIGVICIWAYQNVLGPIRKYLGSSCCIRRTYLFISCTFTPFTIFTASFLFSFSKLPLPLQLPLGRIRMGILSFDFHLLIFGKQWLLFMPPSSGSLGCSRSSLPIVTIVTTRSGQPNIYKIISLLV